MMVRRINVISLLVLFTIVFLITACSPHPPIPLESLLAESPQFPATWETDRGPISVDWQVGRYFFSQEPRYALNATQNLGRTWTDRGDPTGNPEVSEHIFYYDNVLTAMCYFFLLRPEIAWRRQWPNFYFSDLHKYRYPSDWHYRSRYADGEHVVCGMGTLERCQLWFYWARYGQYLLEIRFLAPNQGIGPHLFEQIVAQVEPYVGERLGR